MKNRCKTIKKRSSVLRLDDAPSADLADHIKTCSNCRRVYEADRTVWTILEEYEAPALQTDLLPLLKRRLSGDSGGRRFWDFLTRPDLRSSPWRFATTAAVLLVAGLIIGTWTGSELVTGQNSQLTPAAQRILPNDYSAIFEIEPPGFLTDPMTVGREERR